MSIALIGETQVEQNELFVVVLSALVNTTVAKTVESGMVVNDDSGTIKAPTTGS